MNYVDTRKKQIYKLRMWTRERRGFMNYVDTRTKRVYELCGHNNESGGHKNKAGL